MIHLLYDKCVKQAMSVWLGTKKQNKDIRKTVDFEAISLGGKKRKVALESTRWQEDGNGPRTEPTWQLLWTVKSIFYGLNGYKSEFNKECAGLN